MNKIFSCAFSGHRPKAFSFGFKEDSEEFLEFRLKLKNYITQVCNSGCRLFYCGMAEGVDLWCGELVLEMKDQFDPPLKLCAVIPFLSQVNSMSEKNQERYRMLMDCADERYLVAKDFKKISFFKRNQFMVDSSDALIAVLKEGKERSGTGQTIRYAQRCGKRIFLIKEK